YTQLISPADEGREFQLEVQARLRPELHLRRSVANPLAARPRNRKAARANGGRAAVIADRKLKKDAGGLAVAHAGHVSVRTRKVRVAADRRGQLHLDR